MQEENEDPKPDENGDDDATGDQPGSGGERVGDQPGSGGIQGDQPGSGGDAGDQPGSGGEVQP